MTADILDLASVEPAERTIQIKHPNGRETLPIWVTLMSADDARMKVHQRRITDLQLQKRQRNKSFSAMEMENELCRLVAHAITGWKWEIHYKGEFPEFSIRKAVEILSDPQIPFFFEQVNEAVGDTEAFFQN